MNFRELICCVLAEEIHVCGPMLMRGKKDCKNRKQERKEKKKEKMKNECSGDTGG